MDGTPKFYVGQRVKVIRESIPRLPLGYEAEVLEIDAIHLMIMDKYYRAKWYKDRFVPVAAKEIDFNESINI